MCVDDGEVTILLKAMKNGDECAATKLLPLVYKELHRLASSLMQRERANHTLQPTALIHEAYMRLAGNKVDWQSHQHFIAVAAKVMHRILVDYARAHNAEMRGGDLQRVELEEGLAISQERSEEILAVDEALEKLQAENPRQAQIVELRYFAGFSVEEVAKVLDISPRSVKRDWREAKEWLFNEIQRTATGRPVRSASPS
jgi:RNA polymerase sigma-70 factor (ECF subfamily)